MLRPTAQLAPGCACAQNNPVCCIYLLSKPLLIPPEAPNSMKFHQRQAKGAEKAERKDAA